MQSNKYRYQSPPQVITKPFIEIPTGVYVIFDLWANNTKIAKIRRKKIHGKHHRKKLWNSVNFIRTLFWFSNVKECRVLRTPHNLDQEDKSKI